MNENVEHIAVNPEKFAPTKLKVEPRTCGTEAVLVTSMHVIGW
jgi:hypothetical protein